MLTLQPDHELDAISAGLGRAGAFALILIDCEPLERIERRYGGEAYRGSMDGLKALVKEVVEESAPGEEVLITEERSRCAIAAFVFASRSNVEFYGDALEDLVHRITRDLLIRGRRAVYPYHKNPLELAIGLSVTLHNTAIMPERQILHALEAARKDAQFEVGLRRRRYGRQVLQVILSGDIQVRYEAIVDLNNAQVLGYEALSRGPEGTDLTNPRDLFRRAEEAGLLYELDALCRKIALEGASRLPKERTLFLNCLPTAIGDPGMRDEGLRKTLENFNLRPSDVVLEISETESIDNFGVFREVARSCRDLGIRIAIDDAGTGYASLEAIMEISPDFIKADMTLVREIDSDPARQQVLSALKTIADGIGAEVIAEGIETHGELNVLRELGVRYGQGFYFGAALRASDQCPSGSAS
ncbi:MAG: EAL domain-containing protein [Deltaproteobacteria bacterium]|nr:MAG: EAL domain-containing protein [Deltaproteobacteria bacterium]